MEHQQQLLFVCGFSVLFISACLDFNWTVLICLYVSRLNENQGQSFINHLVTNMVCVNGMYHKEQQSHTIVNLEEL